MDDRYVALLNELDEPLSLSEELERMVNENEPDVVGFWDPVEAAKVMPVKQVSVEEYEREKSKRAA